jgi:phosphoadenosine phosphosulfate reductase
MLSQPIILPEIDDLVDKWFDEIPVASLETLNERLEELTPQEILQWAIITFPKIQQTTSFGVSGCVITDMLVKLNFKKPIIFIDTLYHFTETIDVMKQVKDQYNINIDVYKPEHAENTIQFEKIYGSKLWETNQDLYDQVTKIDPAKRAYLNLSAIITGRRRSQMGNRQTLKILEKPIHGPLKLNPLACWSFDEVMDYINENSVPINSLVQKGYKSIGDWHSTLPVVDGEEERHGRWKGSEKTECGLHTRFGAIKI